jgi:zinc finger-like protein
MVRLALGLAFESLTNHRETQVIYPALDSKVRNVTMAYSVEHSDEELLFEQLSQLLAMALGSNSTGRAESIRRGRVLKGLGHVGGWSWPALHPLLHLLPCEPHSTWSCHARRKLICKVEEIHTTLKKHLAKEEEQLLPLLLQHFTYEEQAELIAQVCAHPHMEAL